MGTFVGILSFVVLLLFAIFFHEFGHFITARWAGIKVSRFFVGFGPTLWSYRRGPDETVTLPDGETVTRPETEYGIKAFPLGGFVKVVGMSPFEEISPEDEPRSFPRAPAWKRAIVLAAGSVTHVLTAFAFLFIIFAILGVPSPTTSIGAVEEESPAHKAEIRPGDKFVAIEGKAVDEWDDVRAAIRTSPGRELDVTLDRNGRSRNVAVTPRSETVVGETIGIIGVIPDSKNQRVNPIVATGRSFRAMGELLTGFVRTAPKAFSPSTLGLSGDGGPSNERPFSIIGAGRIAAGLVDEGELALFFFLFVQINIFIGVFNMLPLPPLDGGHLLILGIEKIRKKPINQRALLPVGAVVFTLLMLLMVLLVYYDIVDPVQLP